MTTQAHTEQSSDSGRMARRTFLGGVAGAAGLSLGGGVLRAPTARATTDVPQRVRGEFRYSSSDGLLAAYIRGPLTAINGSQLELYVPGNVGIRLQGGPVYATVTSESEIQGRGLTTEGDTSPLEIGDDVAVCTQLLDTGERLVTSAVANLRIGHMKVAATSGREVNGYMMHKQATLTDQALNVTFAPESHIGWDMPAIVASIEDVVASMKTGQYMSFMGCLDLDYQDDGALHLWIIGARQYSLKGA